MLNIYTTAFNLQRVKYIILSRHLLTILACLISINVYYLQLMNLFKLSSPLKWETVTYFPHFKCRILKS